MNRQAGVASVELAIIAVVFMLILFSSVEVSRVLFTWNTLDAVTQRAVRVATVCPPGHQDVKPIALFGSPGGSGGLLPGFNLANLQISYLDEDFGDNGTDISGTEYVRARIVNYQHNLAIPFIGDTGITSPPFTATLPRESLGYVPEDGEFACFGSLVS